VDKTSIKNSIDGNIKSGDFTLTRQKYLNNKNNSDTKEIIDKTQGDTTIFTKKVSQDNSISNINENPFADVSPHLIKPEYTSPAQREDLSDEFDFGDPDDPIDGGPDEYLAEPGVSPKKKQ
jgi:hypothetical protein